MRVPSINGPIGCRWFILLACERRIGLRVRELGDNYRTLPGSQIVPWNATAQNMQSWPLPGYRIHYEPTQRPW